MLYYLFCVCFFFFFSSRRRHTRLVSDWSSDVCSSDLTEPTSDSVSGFRISRKPHLQFALLSSPGKRNSSLQLHRSRWERSEERRVGKECRCRWGSAT